MPLYGLTGPPSAYEEDHLIPLGLGGATRKSAHNRFHGGSVMLSLPFSILITRRDGDRRFSYQACMAAACRPPPQFQGLNVVFPLPYSIFRAGAATRYLARRRARQQHPSLLEDPSRTTACLERPTWSYVAGVKRTIVENLSRG
jgi:hypothetical protein